MYVDAPVLVTPCQGIVLSLCFLPPFSPVFYIIFFYLIYNSILCPYFVYLSLLLFLHSIVSLSSPFILLGFWLAYLRAYNVHDHDLILSRGIDLLTSINYPTYLFQILSNTSFLLFILTCVAFNISL